MSPILTVFVIAAIASAVLLAVLIRLLPSHFLAAGINERSNHTQPARQLGGLAIVPVVLALLWLFGARMGLDQRFLVTASIGALILWITGMLDDRYHLPESIRIIAQLTAACLCVYGLGPDFRLLPDFFPVLLERGLLVLALVYFINLTNFMDGLDLMVVSGLGIPLAFLAGFAAFGLAGMASGSIAAAIAGGLCGFALFNRLRAVRPHAIDPDYMNIFNDLDIALTWLGRLDSNQGMAVPKTAALPLGYAPKCRCGCIAPQDSAAL